MLDALTRRYVQAIAETTVKQTLERAGKVEIATGTVSDTGRVKPDGSVSDIPAKNIMQLPLVVGDRVHVMFAPPHGALVIGFAGTALPGAIIPHMARKAIVGGVHTNTSGTYADYPTTCEVTNFRKYRADTVLNIRLHVSAYSGVGSNAAKFGVSIAGVTYDVARQFFNPAATHLSFGNERPIEGLAAGTYSIRLRWQLEGAGDVQTDNNDHLSLVVEETWGDDQ